MKEHKLENRRNPKYKAVIYDYSDEPNSGETYHYLGGATNVDKDDFPTSWISSYRTEVFSGHMRRMVEYMGDKKPKYVVCISFSKMYVLSPNEQRRRSPRDATLEGYKSLALQLEKDFKIEPKKRILIGHSLGGLNAATLMSQPLTRDMWKKVLLINPLFITTPFHSNNPADWVFFGNIYGGGPNLLVETQLKEDEFNAINLLSDAYPLIKEIPAELCIHSSKNDPFKFYQRVAEIQSTAQDEGKEVMIRWNNGGHNFFKAKLAAKFLTEEPPKAPPIKLAS